MNGLAMLPWLAGAFLVGSIPASYLVARWIGGIDLRTVGSGNLGATNLYRAMGWKGALPAGLFDVSKGALPVLVAQQIPSTPEWFPLAMGGASVLGHVFSPFLGFRGGKGVATAAGAFLALAPLSVVIAAVVFVAVVKLSGYVSLGSMVATATFFASVPLMYPGHRPLLFAAGAVFVFILITHRQNVKRLLAGTENRFGRRTAEQPGHRGAA
jgi:acyl phosphate:glycerol-3-phosphate acyltransferase